MSDRHDKVLRDGLHHADRENLIIIAESAIELAKQRDALRSTVERLTKELADLLEVARAAALAEHALREVAAGTMVSGGLQGNAAWSNARRFERAEEARGYIQTALSKPSVRALLSQTAPEGPEHE